MLCFKATTSTIIAYDQTGSGKTYTIGFHVYCCCETFGRMMILTAAVWSNILDTKRRVSYRTGIWFLGCNGIGFSKQKSTQVNTADVRLVLPVKAASTWEAYDKVFNHLDMLHAPLKGKVLILTTAKLHCVEEGFIKFKGDLKLDQDLKMKIAED
ncbi:retrovirus-related pol polyprotein from transposon TNT 1-94 [Tanacetum coccineum]